MVLSLLNYFSKLGGGYILTSKQKGNLTELECLYLFSKQGLKVSIPYGEDCKYDFILDVNGHLLKIQCKTSHLLDNKEGFEFKCQSVVVSRSKITTTKYTLNDIDYFATTQNGICYLVPVENCGCQKILRYCYPKNGQKKGIALAEDYTLDKII